MANIFDQVAKHYNDFIPVHITAHYSLVREEFLKRYIPKKGLVLDVGCGTGNIAGPLSKQSFRIYGLDSSGNMLGELKKKYPKVIIKRGNIDRLPFPSEKFDVTYSIAVFHHLINKELVAAAIKEMIRVTKKGGTLIIWDHNPKNPYWPIILKKLPWDKNVRLVPEEEIIDVAIKLKINLIKVFKKGFIPDFIPKFLMPMTVFCEKILEKIPSINNLAAHNVFVLKKK